MLQLQGVVQDKELYLNAQQLWLLYIDGLVQERHNSSALAMELCLYCTNPLICTSPHKIGRSFPPHPQWCVCLLHIDGLVQERCNSSALAMEFHLSCINPSISTHHWHDNELWMESKTQHKTLVSPLLMHQRHPSLVPQSQPLIGTISQ